MRGAAVGGVHRFAIPIHYSESTRNPLDELPARLLAGGVERCFCAVLSGSLKLSGRDARVAMSPIAPPLASEARHPIPLPAAASRSEDRRVRPVDGDGEASGAVPANAPNPKLRVDAELGLVVLEFRSAQGETTTHPTSRELDAYRRAARSGRPVSGQASPESATPAQAASEPPRSGPSDSGPPPSSQSARGPVPGQPAKGQPAPGQPVPGQPAPGKPALGQPGSGPADGVPKPPPAAASSAPSPAA